jgi:DNA-binding transcriptional MerR regulator
MNDDTLPSGDSTDPKAGGGHDINSPDATPPLHLPKAIPPPVLQQQAQQNPLDAQIAAERVRVAKAHSFRLDTRRVAKYVRVSKRTLEYWRDKEIGPPYLRIGSHVWYELPAIQRWIAGQMPGRYGPPPTGPTLVVADAEPPHPIGNLTRAQAAQYLGICVRTLHYWQGQPGKPQPLNNGTKRVRYSIAALDAWLKAQTHGA